MSTRSWTRLFLLVLVLLTGRVAAQPVPKIIRDINEISDGSGPEPGRTPGAPRRTSSSFPDEMTLIGDRLLFVATSHEVGRELWSYTETTDVVPTSLYLNDPHDDISPSLSSDPGMLTSAGGLLYVAHKNNQGYGVVTIIDGGRKVSTDADLVPATGQVHDIAPLNSGAGVVVAVFDAGTTYFWKVTGDGTAELLAETDHVWVGDVVDCNFETDGFLAFTSLHPDMADGRRLSALYRTSTDPPTVIWEGEVDAFVPMGSKLFFTNVASDGTTGLYVRPSPNDGPIANEPALRHLMVAGTTLYYVSGTPGTSNRIWLYDGTGLPDELEWPDGVQVRSVTSAILVAGEPYVLGFAREDATSYWGIWKLADSGRSMESVAELTQGWTDCSQLVANGTGKLAFFGQYHPTNPDARSLHLGFYYGNWIWHKAIADVATGTRPRSMIALANRVVFVAQHRQLGVEPWSCSFPPW